MTGWAGLIEIDQTIFAVYTGNEVFAAVVVVCRHFAYALAMSAGGGNGLDAGATALIAVGQGRSISL